MAFTVLLLLAPKPFEGRSALLDSCVDINSAPSVEELRERCRKAEGCAGKRKGVLERGAGKRGLECEATRHSVGHATCHDVIIARHRKHATAAGVMTTL